MPRRERRCRRLIVGSMLVPLATTATSAWAQAIGPDMINSSLFDMQRYGTDAAGTTTAYAIGAVTCNAGDLPAMTQPDAATRPLIAQNLYRLKSYGPYQRFEQIGQSWVKRVGLPIAGNHASCGTCTPSGDARMGVHCADVYGSGFNGSQGLLGPRSLINPATGVSLGGAGTSTGDPITRGRLQVATSDVVAQPAGTRFFGETVILLPDDATYLRPGQQLAVNAMNNASTQEVNINGGTTTPTLIGPGTRQISALERWREVDPEVVVVNLDHDDTPNPRRPDTYIRSRFQVAARVWQVSPAHWRYEYAVFNLNSDRAGGWVEIPLPATVEVSDVTFQAPRSHSGEPYSNAAWTITRPGDSIRFATTPFASDPNANALRWGTSYTFGLTSRAAPAAAGSLTLGLFEPGPVATLVASGVPVPAGPPCDADYTIDGIVDQDDVEYLVGVVAGGSNPAGIDPDFNRDGNVDQGDIDALINVVAGGACP